MLRSYIIILFITVIFSARSQDLVSEANGSFDIVWSSEFPDKSKQDRSFKKEQITDFIFGAKIRKPSKPVAIAALNPDSVFILDQGVQNPFSFLNGMGEITQFKNKDYKAFPSLLGICLFKNDTYLFTDSYLNQIFITDYSGKNVSLLNDSIVLNQPTGIAYNPDNKEIWITETKEHRLVVLNEEGKLIKTIGERGIEPGQFNFPTSIFIDKTGTIYVVDAMNFRIQVFDNTGKILSVFGEIGDATGFLSRPKGIAVDSWGHIYVADAMYNAVQVFNQKGDFLFTFGTQGRDKSQFWMPMGLYIDSKDNIYVADSYNSRIQVFRVVKK